jgi:Helix-turn-helix domain
VAEFELHLTDSDVEHIANQVADLIAKKLIPPAVPALLGEWLTTPQAAKHLGLSVQRLEIWRSAGGGPKYHKPSRGIVRYRVTELDEFMATNARRHTGEDAVPAPRHKGARR